MARRVLNRRELREAADAAEAKDSQVKETDEAPKKKAAKKAPPAVKVKKTRKKKEPPRMCARWGVFDAAMKQVAIFAYNQKAEADQKVADLVAKKKAVYFLQMVKEPMAEVPSQEETP